MYRVWVLLSFLSLQLFAFSCDAFDKSSIEIGANRGSMGGLLGDGKKDSMLSLEHDLDLKKSKNSLSAKLQSGFNNHKFGFKFSSFDYSGKKKITKDIIFNSETFAKASMLQSRLSLKWAKGSYRYKIAEGILVGANLNGLRAKFTLNGKHYHKHIIIPSLAIDYRFDLAHDLAILTKASLTPIGKNRALDSYAGLAIKLPFHHCSCLNLGYQVSHINIDTKGFQNELDYKGLYAGIKIGF